MPTELSIDGNEAFEQAKSLTAEFLGTNETRSILVVVHNHTGLNFMEFGRYIEAPGDFSGYHADTRGLPATVTGKKGEVGYGTDVFAMLGQGSDARACGAVSYICDMRPHLPGKSGRQFLLFTVVALNPHSQTNKIGAFWEYVNGEQSGPLGPFGHVSFATYAEQFETRTNGFPREYAKRFYDVVDGKSGQITSDDTSNDWWGDRYRIKARLDRNEFSTHEHDLLAEFTVSRDSFQVT